MGRRKADRFDASHSVNSIDEMDNRFDQYFTEDQIRQNIEMDFRNAFWFDKNRQPKDVVYSWPTRTLFDRTNDDGMRECFAIGWKLVPPERHPELSVPNYFDREDRRKATHIEVKGHVLMERHIELERKAQEVTHRRNMESLRSSDSLEKYTGMTSYPIGINKNVTEMTGNMFRSFN